jgi:hypothetical protein
MSGELHRQAVSFGLDRLETDASDAPETLAT